MQLNPVQTGAQHLMKVLQLNFLPITLWIKLANFQQMQVQFPAFWVAGQQAGRIYNL